MYRKSGPGAPERHVWCKSRAGCSPCRGRAAAASASCPRTSSPTSVRLAATTRTSRIMLGLHTHTLTLMQPKPLMHVHMRASRAQGPYSSFVAVLFSANKLTSMPTVGTVACHVDRLCAQCVRACRIKWAQPTFSALCAPFLVPVSLHGPRHMSCLL